MLALVPHVLGVAPAQQTSLQQQPEPVKHVDFVEVGCSDFNTAAQLTTLPGISVEVIPAYLNNIPERPGLRKVNVAVSNVTGEDVNVYWTDPRAISPTEDKDFLAAHGLSCALPKWLRGCNQVGSMHANIKYAFDPTREPAGAKTVGMNSFCGGSISDRGLVHVTPTPVRTVEQILDDEGVASMNFFKVDTEGFDAKVVNSLLDAVSLRPSRRPDHIKYEHVHLEAAEKSALRARLVASGYECHSDEADVTCSHTKSATPLPWILHKTGIADYAPDATEHSKSVWSRYASWSRWKAAVSRSKA